MSEFLADAGDDRESTILSPSPRRIVNNTVGNRRTRDIIIKAFAIFIIRSPVNSELDLR